MGLIRAAIGSVGGNLADQWKEYFYCDAMNENVLVRKASHRTSSRSSNRRGSENIITTGSVIAVADGQCMLIVDQGKVMEVCAEPGEFIYDSSTSPTIFSGKLGQSIVASFKDMLKRFTFGGEPPKDQRIYYINTKELIGNKYGTPSPVPFRVVDQNIGLDMDIAIRCFGEYSYHIFDPILFYTNVCGNVEDDYTRDRIDSQLKSELLTSLQPAFATISGMGIRYSALPGHTVEIAEALNNVLSEKWRNLRGIEIVSLGVSSVKANEEDEKTIKELQKSAVYRNPNMAAANLASAQADAMRNAASNPNGAFTGFMGMGMAQTAGGMNAASLFQMGQNMPTPPTAPAAPEAPAAAPAQSAAQNSWTCTCGAVNTSKFCMECGTQKPEQNTWTCSCGSVNTGKFCTECGKKRMVVYRCDKCGWTPADPENPPKFCPECGDPFNDQDQV